MTLRIAICLSFVTALAAAQVVPPLPVIPSPLGTMPSVEELPARNELPPVLINDDGSPVTRETWPARREQMKRILEYYATGVAPPPPGNVTAETLEDKTVADGKVEYRLIKLTFGPDRSLSLHVGCFTPANSGPVPAVVMIGGAVPDAPKLDLLPLGPTQGSNRDALSVVGAAGVAAATQPSSGWAPWSAEQIARTEPAIQRGWAFVQFDNNECGQDTTLRNADGSWAFRSRNFAAAYPSFDWGLLRIWAWGASRAADALQNDPHIDARKLIICGFSRTAKAALIAGAFDERFAVVAPIASSGGGTPAYRFSGVEHGGNEGLSEMLRKYPNWFGPQLRPFIGQAEKLPFDQHWLIALCAPRPMIALEGTRDPNVNHEGVRQSFLAAKPVYQMLAADDSLGVHWANRGHGMVTGDWAALLAMADHAFTGKALPEPMDNFPASQPVNR